MPHTKSMTNKASRSILCYNIKWHESLMERIDSNTLANHDMLWICCDGTTVKDYRSPYINSSPFLQSLVQHGSVCTGGGELIRVSVTGFLEDPVLFRFLRVFCHTGITLLEENESFSQLYSKHTMCQCYCLDVSKSIVAAALAVKMDHAGAIRILSDNCGTLLEEDEITTTAACFFKRHPQECLKKMTPTAISKMSCAVFLTIMKLLGDSDVNASESDVLEEVYTLCLKRCRNDVHAARELFFSGEDGAVPWNSVHPENITFEQIMEFKQRYSTAFEPEFYLNVMDKIYRPKSSSPPSAAPRQYHAVSSYPRHLHFPPLKANSYVCSTLESLNYTISYIAVPVLRSGTIDVPAFIIAGSRVLTLQMLFQGQHVNCSGGLNLGVGSSTMDSNITSIELRVVNFCRDRSKKTETAIDVLPNNSFFIPKIILITTLENDYTFDVCMYPTIVAGSHMLLKVTCKTVDQRKRTMSQSCE